MEILGRLKYSSMVEIFFITVYLIIAHEVGHGIFFLCMPLLKKESLLLAKLKHSYLVFEIIEAAFHSSKTCGVVLETIFITQVRSWHKM